MTGQRCAASWAANWAMLQVLKLKPETDRRQNWKLK